MRIAELIKLTEVEGPGTRAAIWLQGCTIRCKGCCNPNYLDPSGGQEYDPHKLAEELANLSQNIEGITLLGGEPLDQAEELEKFLSHLHKISNLGIILFTGYTWDVVSHQYSNIAKLCDLIKAGPFEIDNYPDTRRWIGSTNQTLHFLTDRYRALAESWPKFRREIEIHLRPDAIVINGTPFENIFDFGDIR